MALRKRNNSQKIKKAGNRFNAMEKIDLRYRKIINYGGDKNPLTKNDMKMQIEQSKKLIEEYNTILFEADRKSSEIKQAEEKLGDMCTRVLAGGVSIFGVDSNEIKELGGTRKSERKKSGKKDKVSSEA